MAYEFIEYEVNSEVQAAIITLNRPEARNALSQRTIEEALDAAQQAMGDPQVRSVILTGKGERAFAAGADIGELKRRDMFTELGSWSGDRRRLTLLLEQGDKPAIAAVNGDAIGGGLEIALACAVRVCVPTARLGLGEINLGLLPGNGGTQRLVRLVGLGRAMEIILTGDLIRGEEAYRIGLVNRVVTLDELMPVAFGFARKFAAKSPMSLRAAKESILIALDVPLAAGLAFENKWWALLNSMPDKREGVDAFLEKRPPRFGQPVSDGALNRAKSLEDE